MASEWFYTLNGEKHGPVSSHEIRRLARAGTISPTDLLWKQGMQAWLPAGKSNSLFPPAAKITSESQVTLHTTPTEDSRKEKSATQAWADYCKAVNRIFAGIAIPCDKSTITGGTIRSEKTSSLPSETDSKVLSSTPEDDTWPAGLSANDFGWNGRAGADAWSFLRRQVAALTEAFGRLKPQHQLAIGISGLAIVIAINSIRENRSAISPASTLGGASYIDNAKGTTLRETIVRVREGMTVSEVRRLLGEPAAIHTLDSRTRAWNYVAKIPAIDEYDTAKYEKWAVYFNRPETQVKSPGALRVDR